MPGRLITSKKIKAGSVSHIGRTFDKRDAKAKEARIHFYFPTASTAGNPAPVSRPHALGKVPTAYTVVSKRRDPAAGPPGTIFDVFPFASRAYITLQCSTAETWAEIIVH